MSKNLELARQHRAQVGEFRVTLTFPNIDRPSSFDDRGPPLGGGALEQPPIQPAAGKPVPRGKTSQPGGGFGLRVEAIPDLDQQVARDCRVLGTRQRPPLLSINSRIGIPISTENLKEASPQTGARSSIGPTYRPVRAGLGFCD